jgi:surfactin synthase thioesterase subunit
VLCNCCTAAAYTTPLERFAVIGEFAISNPFEYGIELKPLSKAARLLIGRHDKYPTSAPAGAWSMNYQDAQFIQGDIIQLSLTEETLLS